MDIIEELNGNVLSLAVDTAGTKGMAHGPLNK